MADKPFMGRPSLTRTIQQRMAGNTSTYYLTVTKPMCILLAFARMPLAPVLRSSATAEGGEARGASLLGHGLATKEMKPFQILWETCIC